jgi:hypothetical protein
MNVRSYTECVGVVVLAKNKKQQDNRMVMIIGGVVGLLIIISLVVAFSQGKKDYTNFATCLVEKGYVMAGTEWCPHCQSQKSQFKGAFEEVIIPGGAYVDCDRNQQWCVENNVQGYPTWLTPEGNSLSGVQSMSTLARISGCSI